MSRLNTAWIVKCVLSLVVSTDSLFISKRVDITKFQVSIDFGFIDNNLEKDFDLYAQVWILLNLLRFFSGISLKNSLGIWGEFGGNILRFLWECFGNSLEIFFELFGNSLRIVWGCMVEGFWFGNFLGILWNFKLHTDTELALWH